MQEEYRQDFTFELAKPINYQSEDGEKESNILVLYAPSNKLAKQKDKFRQKILVAFVAAGKNSNQNINQDAQNEKKDLKPEEILFALASNDNFIQIKDAFIELLKSGCASLNGELQLTDWHVNQIDDWQLEELMGEYIVNFIIPSWMKRLLEK